MGAGREVARGGRSQKGSGPGAVWIYGREKLSGRRAKAGEPGRPGLGAVREVARGGRSQKGSEPGAVLDLREEKKNV